MRIGLALPALALACALTSAVPASAAERHGDLIRSKALTKKFHVAGSASTHRVVYRSTSLAGKKVPVSGVVMLPEGKPPKAGWPVVSFAHGTTGIADQCAPSRYPLLRGDYGKQHLGPLFRGYLKAGYAVAQSDYEGLGTRGVHPYLVGRSAARSVLDMARAARDLDGRVGKRLLLSGHSQGGHAAIWAGAEARRWTPELKLLGTQAFAPLSHASTLVRAARSITTKGGLAPEAAMFLRALDTTFPAKNLQAIMSDRALELYPQTLDRCLDELFAADSFGGTSVAELIREDADLEPLIELTEQQVDFNDHKLPGGVLLLQGSADTTIPQALSDALAEDFRAAEAKLSYRVYEGADHSSVMSAGRKHALAYAKARLK